METSVPQLTGPRAAATLFDLGFGSVASGVIARRRPLVGLMERTQADARAVQRMRRLRHEFGRGPVELTIPGRRVLIPLDPQDVGRVLSQAPNPFHPANYEKHKALRWFQPHGVLISRGPIRQQRRAMNEAALESGADLHRLAGAFAELIAAESRDLAADAAQCGRLDSDRFMIAWWRLVRLLTLGERARDDHMITDELLRLRRAGN